MQPGWISGYGSKGYGINRNVKWRKPAMTVATAKWSLEDYHRTIAAGILVDRRVELLKGDIVDMAIAVAAILNP